MKNELADYVPAELKPYLYKSFQNKNGFWFEFFSDNNMIPIFKSTGVSAVHEKTIEDAIDAMKPDVYKIILVEEPIEN